MLNGWFEEHKVEFANAHINHEEAKKRFSYRLFNKVVRPFLISQSKRWFLVGGVLLLITGSLLLVLTQRVVLKMLPFDNKSEFQIVVDMPEGTTLGNHCTGIG